MTSSMYIDTVVSRTLDSIFCSIVLHFTLHTPMPRETQTAVEHSSAICDGPANESLPKTEIVTLSSTIRVIRGIALSHADGSFIILICFSFYCVFTVVRVRVPAGAGVRRDTVPPV